MKRWALPVSMALTLAITLMTPVSALAHAEVQEFEATGWVEIVPKVTYPFSPHSTPTGQEPKGLSGQQFVPIAGILGELPEGGKRYAVVIGSNYEGIDPDTEIAPLIPPFFPVLRFAKDDAQDIADLLMWRYGFDSVIPLIGDHASRENILTNIAAIAELEERGDEVVFFYSGHGAQHVQGKKAEGTTGWGAIHEGIVTDEGSTVDFIWDDELKKAFQHFDSDRIVFVFDMCLAGGMTELAGNGRIVAMATTKTGIAAEVGDEFGYPINHGLFTAFLLAALTGNEFPMAPAGSADAFDHLPGVPDVTIEEAFNFASGALMALSPMIQPGIEFYYGPEIAALWRTPTIKDDFKKDLLP